MKRFVTIAMSVAAILAAATSPRVVAAPSDPSPMFRGNPAHAGVYDAPGAPVLHGVKWQFKTHGQVYSSPAVANGVVYVGSADGNLYALDLSAGTEIWKFATKGRVASSPAVANGQVYFSSYDSNIYAVDAATGKQTWAFATGGERRYSAKHIHGMLSETELMPDPFDFFLSSPTIVNGVAYAGSGDGNVYALDALTGALRWKFKTGDVVHASPAVSGGRVFVGSWDTYFYAIDAATGREQWKFKTGDDPDIHNHTGIQASALVADGVVYFGCRDAKLYALDANTGRQIWAIDNKGSWVIGSPAIKDGVIYFTTSESGIFHAADAKTGAERFSISFKWPMFSSPAAAGTLVYIGSHEGKLIAVDTAAKKAAWIFETDGSHKNGATYTAPDGTPNYGAAMASMFYDDIVSGIQKMFSVGAILSSPVVAGDTIIFGSADGSVYAIH